MPKTDYSDPEIKFPRLEARLFTIDGSTQLLDLWLHKSPGVEKLRLTRSQRAGSIDDAHGLIQEFCVKHSAVCEPDDITVEG